MKSRATEVRYSTTVELGNNSTLYSYILTESVSLTIPGDHEISIHFTPAQLPCLEEIVTNLKLLEKQQRLEEIEAVSKRLQQLSETEAMNQELEPLGNEMQLSQEQSSSESNNGYVAVTHMKIPTN